MYAINRVKPQPPKGKRTWHNSTNRTLRLRMLNDAGQFETVEVEPYGSIQLTVALSDVEVKRLCKALSPEPTKPSRKPEQPPPPMPSEAEEEETEPLGDGTQPRAVTADDGTQQDSERTAGDALEAFAQSLEAKHTYSDLQKMAADLDLATGGKKIDVARRLAKELAR